MKIKKYCIFATFVLFSLFCGCNNSASIKNSNAENCCIELVCVQENHRGAIPNIDQPYFDDCYWIFNFRNLKNDEILKYNSENLQKSAYGFIIPIQPGNWTISVIGYLKLQNNESQVLFYSTEQIFDLDENGYYRLEIPVAPNDDGFGKVDLLIQVDNPNITELVILGSDTDLDGSYTKENNLFHLQKEMIKSGTYNVILQFMDQHEICFVLPETINIRNNFITDLWIGNSVNTIGCVDNKILILGDDLFTKQTIFYVKGKSGELSKINFSNGTSNVSLGSILNPFDSLKSAIAAVISINDQVSTYTIYIDGIIFPDNDYDFSDSMNNAFINLVSENPLKLRFCGLNSNAIIDAKRSDKNPGRVMYIGKNIQLFIENLRITGGYTSLDGGGIYLSSELPVEDDAYNLILGENVTICDNQTEGSGGGIFIDKGKVKIEGRNTSICHNIAKTKGGGICLFGLSDKTARILDVYGGNITANNSISATGKNGVGGGLYTQFATVHLENLDISENMAANGGGIGIAQNSILYLNNTKIVDNLASYEKGKGGGGIFASGVSSKLFLQNGTEIIKNDSFSISNKGGGISATSTDLYIGDNVHVLNNTYNSVEISNLSSSFSKLLNIEEELNSTNIGITVLEFEKLPFVFTKKYGVYNSNQVELFFFSDEDAYFVENSETNEGMLRLSLSS